MKKTCGALVIGLLITTSTSFVFARENTKKSSCKDPYVNSVMVRTGMKLSESQCIAMESVFHEAYDDGFNEGASHGMAVASDGFTPKVKQAKCPPCPSCDSYSVPSQNDIQRQQELEDAERRGYYLNETQQLLKRK